MCYLAVGLVGGGVAKEVHDGNLGAAVGGRGGLPVQQRVIGAAIHVNGNVALTQQIRHAHRASCRVQVYIPSRSAPYLQNTPPVLSPSPCTRS